MHFLITDRVPWPIWQFVVKSVVRLNTGSLPEAFRSSINYKNTILANLLFNCSFLASAFFFFSDFCADFFFAGLGVPLWSCLAGDKLNRSGVLEWIALESYCGASCERDCVCAVVVALGIIGRWTSSAVAAGWGGRLFRKYLSLSLVEGDWNRPLPSEELYYYSEFCKIRFYSLKWAGGTMRLSWWNVTLSAYNISISTTVPSWSSP